MPEKEGLISARPTIFWEWLSDVTDDEIRATLKDFKIKGYSGFFVLPMPKGFRDQDFHSTLSCQFVDDELLRRYKVCAQVAESLDLQMWLYDEGGWPSGQANGEVIRRYPECRQKLLHVGTPDDKSRVVYQWRRGDVALTFFWDYHPSLTDHLSAEATQHFIELVHEKFASVLKPYFGRVIPGIFTDEPRLDGLVGTKSIPWRVDFPLLFKQRYGYELGPVLPALFGAEALGFDLKTLMDEVEIASARYDFCDLLTECFAEGFFAPIKKWCSENNLLFIGHVCGDNNLANNFRLNGHFFRTISKLDVPGIDVVWRDAYRGQKNTHFPLLGRSAALRQGVSSLLCEAYAVYGLGLHPADMKWIINWLGSRGVNVVATMLVQSDFLGAHLIGEASHLGPGNPMWNYQKLVNDYSERVFSSISQVRPEIQIGYYYPITSLWITPIDQHVRFAESFENIASVLMKQGLSFIHIDDDWIKDATVWDGTIRGENLSLTHLVFPAIKTLKLKVLKKLCEFVKTGGKVIFADGLPVMCSDYNSADEFNVLIDTLSRSDGVQILQSGKGIDSISNISNNFPLIDVDSDGEIYYFGCIWNGQRAIWISNEGERCKLKMSWDYTNGKSILMYDVETGRTFYLKGFVAGNRVNAEVWIPPHSVAIATTDNMKVSPKSYESLPLSWAAVQITSPVMRIEKSGWEIVISARYSIEDNRIVERHNLTEKLSGGELVPWSEMGFPELSGKVRYQKHFIWREEKSTPKGKFLLNLGEVCYIAECWLNGTYLGIRSWPPFVFDVTEYLKDGENKLEIIVTNTLANQINRDDLVAYWKEQKWWNCYADKAYAFQKEFLKSGLLGLVVLIKV